MHLHKHMRGEKTSMDRDLQIKYLKGMYKELHGTFPHHLKFENMDDDQIDSLFNELRDEIDKKRASNDDVDPEVLRRYTSPSPSNNTMAFHFKR